MITAAAINAMVDDKWPSARIPCVEVSDSHALAELVPTAGDIRPGGFISGPTQFAVADAALWYLVSGAVGRVEPMAVTSELSIRFLRPAVGARLYARARLERLGRTSLVGTISVWTDQHHDAHSATAQGTYALPVG